MICKFADNPHPGGALETTPAHPQRRLILNPPRSSERFMRVMDYFLVSCPWETNLPGINNQFESVLDSLSRSTRLHFMCSWFQKVLLRFPFIKLLIKHEIYNDVRDICVEDGQLFSLPRNYEYQSNRRSPVFGRRIAAITMLTTTIPNISIPFDSAQPRVNTQVQDHEVLSATATSMAQMSIPFDRQYYKGLDAESSQSLPINSVVVASDQKSPNRNLSYARDIVQS